MDQSHFGSRLFPWQGCAPLVSQLPTDQLGPAEQHREADVVSVTFATKGGQRGRQLGIKDLHISTQFLF